MMTNVIEPTAQWFQFHAQCRIKGGVEDAAASGPLVK